MTTTATADEADGLALVEACRRGDGVAWRDLLDRHGPLLEAIVLRTIDERRGGQIDEAPTCLGAVLNHLRRDDGEALRAWGGVGGLRHYLAVVTRQVALAHLQDATPRIVSLENLPSQAAIFLDDLLGGDAERITATLDRLSPQIPTLIRLRLRGMSRRSIGAALGLPDKVVQANLERVAGRLGELSAHGSDKERSASGDVGDATAAWRILLDAGSPAQRVELALRTEDDVDFRATRKVAQQSFRDVRDRAPSQLHLRTNSCIDERTVAAFVDGSLRGPDRARVEGHVTTCTRCIDVVAGLSGDLRTTVPLREGARHGREVALIAACASTERLRVAMALAERTAEHGSGIAESLLEIVRLAMALETNNREGLAEPSRVVATLAPSDAEAPILAFKALVTGDLHAAARAIDDAAARQALGARLRLIAAAAGEDIAGCSALATELEQRHRSDPGLLTDVEIVHALPSGRAMPREIVIERLRSLLPALIRHVLATA